MVRAYNGSPKDHLFIYVADDETISPNKMYVLQFFPDNSRNFQVTTYSRIFFKKLSHLQKHLVHNKIANNEVSVYDVPPKDNLLSYVAENRTVTPNKEYVLQFFSKNNSNFQVMRTKKVMLKLVTLY